MLPSCLSHYGFMGWFQNALDHVKTTAKGLGTRISAGQNGYLNLPHPKPIEDDDNIKQDELHPCAAYNELKDNFRDIGRMNGIIEALGRDFLTAMPEGAVKSRLGQIGFLARRCHEDLASAHIAQLIEDAHAHQRNNPSDWDDWDTANLREMEGMYRHHCQVNPDLIEQRAQLAYDGRRLQRDCAANNDWKTAQKFLENMIDLQRKIAESKCLNDNDHKESSYQAIMREYMPYAKLDVIDDLFNAYEAEVRELLPQILKKQDADKTPYPLIAPFDAQAQMWLNRSMLSYIGFDFKRGGLFETGHNPIEGGTPDDTRLVIKTVSENDFSVSLKSALHEGGHGLYIQGLPRTQWRYQPVAQDLGAGVQESQALLVEMILGRMPEFYDYLAPRLEGLFQKFGDPSMQARNLWRLKTRVRKGLDRKKADEVTYFLHILHRFKLERQLISGKLAVKDLPEAWRASMKDLLGVEPDNHAEGVLQDAQWFTGKFGYFPSYTLGHMIAAQFYEAMNRDLGDVPQMIKDGNFLPIRDWLNVNIHEKGRLIPTYDLIREVTGSDLSHEALVRHIKARYL